MKTTPEQMRVDVEVTRNTARDAAAQPRLSLHLARTAADLADAQRLRYKVFAEELARRCRVTTATTPTSSTASATT